LHPDVQPMKRKHKRAVQAGTVVAVLGGLATVWAQVDSYLIERQRKLHQMAYEMKVQECELSGGKWWRGTCEPVP
jgi:hypothetical protein